MPKSRDQFSAEHKAFRKRLQAINKSAVGIAARGAMNNLRAAYREAALLHWAELGNRASTGWGSVPEADYQTARTPTQCADEITRVLVTYFATDPDNPPGHT